MLPDTVLSFQGTAVNARLYNGSQSQSFLLTGNAGEDQFVQNRYTRYRLSCEGTRLWAQPEEDVRTQRFRIRRYSDDTVSIQSVLTGYVLTFNHQTPTMEILVAGNLNQRFRLVTQGDGSIGIRRHRWATFEATVDRFAAVYRLGTRFPLMNRQPTGFYAPKNSAFKVIVVHTDTPPIAMNLFIGAPYADTDTQYSQQRTYPLQLGTNTITDPGGGVIYFQLANEINAANVIILGAQELPYFEHGNTSTAVYHAMLDARPTPYVELYSARVVLTVDRASAQAYKNSDIPLLMATYERIIDVQETLLGLDKAEELHAPAPLKYHLVLGNHGGAGSAHATTGYTAYNMAYAQGLLEPERLKAEWAVPHEIGHQNQMRAYLPNDFSEVTNNLSAMATQRVFGVRSNLTHPGANGKDTWDNALEKQAASDLDITQLSAFERLAALEQLRLGFGDTFWPRLNRIAREHGPWSTTPSRAQSFDNLALFGSMAAWADLRAFVRAWGMPLSTAADQQIAEMRLPAPPADLLTLREPRAGVSASSGPEKEPECGTEPPGDTSLLKGT